MTAPGTVHPVVYRSLHSDRSRAVFAVLVQQAEPMMARPIAQAAGLTYQRTWTVLCRAETAGMVRRLWAAGGRGHTFELTAFGAAFVAERPADST